MNYFESVIREYINMGSFRANKVKALVIDDAARDFSLQRDLLKIYGIKCDTIPSNANYLSLIKKQKYEIIFIDYSNEETNFEILATNIRNIDVNAPAYSAYCSTVPIVVVISNKATGGNNKKVVLGEVVDDFMVKPIQSFYLDRMLKKWIPSSKREPKLESEQVIAQSGNAPNSVNNTNAKDEWGIDDISEEFALRQCGYDRRRLFHNLAAIVKLGHNKMNELSEYVNKQDYSNYIEQIKSLKLYMQDNGVNTISELAKVQQIAGLAGNYSFIEERFPDLMEAMKRMQNQIRMYLERNSKSKDKKDMRIPISETEFKNELLVALSYLDNIMPNGAITVLEKMLICDIPIDWETAVDHIIETIEDMEYEKAMLLLSECLKN